MIFKNSPPIRFVYKRYKFEIKFVWRGIILFITLDNNIPEDIYWEARYWFLNHQEEFDLQGMTDPILGYLET